MHNKQKQNKKVLIKEWEETCAHKALTPAGSREDLCPTAYSLISQHAIHIGSFNTESVELEAH